MSTTLPGLDEPGDAELISAVRGGDVEAYGELYSRHVGAADRLSRQLVRSGDADDLVSEAFAKVLVVLQRGDGPDLAFRAYLLTSIRRLHVDRLRAGARLHSTDDLTPFDPGTPFRDTAVEGFESVAAARAFASLPERWQTVLWHTEVEGQRPAEVAPLLGMSANSVSALAYRAREGLRQAFLEMHLQDVEDDACGWTHRNLGAYVRNGISRRDAVRVEHHLTGCRRCSAIYLELHEVNSNLSGILAPALLGGALAAAYAGSAGGAVAKGGLLLLLGRARDLVVTNATASAVAGVAATAVLGGSVFLTLDREPPASPPAAPGASSAPGTAEREDPTGDRSDRTGPDGFRRDGSPRPADPALPGPGDLPRSPQLPTAPAAPEEPERHTGPPSAEVAPADQPPGVEAPEPASEPQQPAGTDLGVRATVTQNGPAIFTVVVAVTGLEPASTARLEVTGSGLAALATRDDRCGVGVGSGSCAVGDAPTTYEFRAVAEPTGSSFLTFTVLAEGSGSDRDPGNDSDTVRLAS